METMAQEFERVRVTMEDIRLGQRGIPTLCPVALALNRLVGGQWTVHYVSLTSSNTTSIPTPREVQEFLIAFDQVEPCRPFSFRIPTQKHKSADATRQEATMTTLTSHTP